jgi:hypothetical protein
MGQCNKHDDGNVTGSDQRTARRLSVLKKHMHDTIQKGNGIRKKEKEKG